MANNFRLSVKNGWYVGKANTGGGNGTADTPYSRLMDVFNNNPNPDTGSTSVVGTGTYLFPSLEERLVNGQYDRPWGNMFADGFVKLIGRSEEITVLGSRRCGWFGFYFEQALGYGFGYDNNTYSGCILKVLATQAGTVNSSASSTAIYDSVLFNINMATSNLSLTRCILINCTFGDGVSLDSCYLDATSAVSTSLAITNCNVDPRANTDGSKGIQRITSGTAGPWTKTGTGYISVLPNFNSVAREDFTLQATSPHVALAIGPNQYRYSNSFYAEFSGGSGDLASTGNVLFRSTANKSTVALADITGGATGFDVNTQNGLVLHASSVSDGTGTLTTGRIPFADTNEEITVMYLKAGLNLNTDFPTQESLFNFNQPEVYNNNVPDFSNGAAGSATRNPNRLSYQMRWSQKVDPNPDLANVEDWVNGTQFVEFEWNAKPAWNPTTMIGNGDATYVVANGVTIICRWYQLRVRMRNNYYR